MKRVVARVRTPACSRTWHALRPSQVLGILMQMRDWGWVGERWWVRLSMPVLWVNRGGVSGGSVVLCWVYVEGIYGGMDGRTEGVDDGLFGGVGVVGVCLDVDVAGDVGGDSEGEGYHLVRFIYSICGELMVLGRRREGVRTAISMASSSMVRPGYSWMRALALVREDWRSSACSGLVSSL